MAVNHYPLEIAKEAYRQVQLNERQSDHIIGVRSYKYIQGDCSLHYREPFLARAGEHFQRPRYQE